MYFKTSLFCTLLVASVTLAVPTTLPGSGLARRREGRQSRPMNHIAQEGVSSVERRTSVGYSEDWAGAAYENEFNGTFISVTGTFTVPTPSGNPGTSASAWVGIDGSTCDSAILQTGVDFHVDENGGVSYDAWYEWFPQDTVTFSGISISAGDVVIATVVAYSNTSGTATIVNSSNGQQASQYITSDSPLCQSNAEWIVEDYGDNGGLVPFADFGTVTFTDAYAYTVYSNRWYVAGADLSDIQQNGQDLTTSYFDSNGDLVIEYV